MKFKHSQIDIPVDDPFKNCKLGRRRYGEALSDIIEIQSGGFVLAIDSKWGTGKTTFVEMWRQLLINKGYKTLYFNSWVNDFDLNPLVAILSELKTLSPQSTNFKSLLKRGAIFTKTVLPALVKAVAEKHIDTKVFLDTIENITKSAVDILSDEVDEYAKKKKGLNDFKESLEKYVSSQTDDKPLIFYIDELDRCRPHYAVEVLEQIKHFFSVPGIVFVLAIDKEQLSGAINGFYGSDKINSKEYLRRFIDIEYTIPEPPTGAFCNYLADYYQFDDFFKNRLHPELKGEKGAFIRIATRLFDKDKTSLRRQAKIFAHARLSINLVKDDHYLFPELFFLLIFLRDVDKITYDQINSKQLSVQEMIDKLPIVFPQDPERDELRSFIFLEADLARYYENYVNNAHHPSKVMVETAGSFTLMISSSYNNSDANKLLENALMGHSRTNKTEISLQIILDKIDLIEQITK